MLIFYVINASLILRETAPGWLAEDIQLLTEPRLTIPDDISET